MKTKYLFQVSAFLLGIVVMFGCVKWEEFQPINVASAPTVTLTLGSAGDSTITVGVTSNMNGYIGIILLSGTGNAVPDSAALLSENVVYDEFASVEVTANEAVNISFSSVVQDSDYEVMAVAANEDGVVSDVAVLAITTDDSYGPGLVGGTPAFGYGAVVMPGDTLVLNFDEAVALGDGDFTFESFYFGNTEVVPAANKWASGSSVYIVLPWDPDYRDYLWLDYEAGAVEDMAGNACAALNTDWNEAGDGFDGAYWRMAAFTYDVASVAPDVAVAQTPGFDIVLTFDDAIDADDVTDGDITITYDDGAGIQTTVAVPAADVVAAGNDLTISQTVFTPVAGTVTVDIPEGLLYVGIGNPVVAISETWDLQ